MVSDCYSLMFFNLEYIVTNSATQYMGNWFKEIVLPDYSYLTQCKALNFLLFSHSGVV